MGGNIISIITNPTFSFSECMWFLSRNYDDCTHSIVNNRILKAVLIFEKPFLLGISQNQDLLEIEILAGEFDAATGPEIKNYVVEWFDLDRNLQPFYQLLGQNIKLSYMTKEFEGLRLIGIPDLFEALCWGITGQQINLTFAYRLKRRLVEKYGSRIEFKNEKFHIFPTPKVLSEADPDDLKAMQYSAKKAEYIIGVAKCFAEKKLSKEILIALPDLEARQKILMSVKGIGIWTANYALMKSLKEQSSIPYGDSGLLQALVSHKIISDKKDNLHIRNFFQELSGWESYTVFYLWRSLSKKSPEM